MAIFKVPVLDDNGEPTASHSFAEVTSRRGDCVRVRLAGRTADCEYPKVLFERRAHGWIAFVLVDDAGEVARIHLHDDGRAALERDNYRTERMSIGEPGDDAAFDVCKP